MGRDPEAMETVQTMQALSPTSRRALVVLATVVTLVAARHAAAVLAPLAFALFVVAVLWPVQRRLGHALPSWIAALACVLLFAAFAAVVAGLLAVAGRQVVEHAQAHGTLEEVTAVVREWMAQRGLELEGDPLSLPSRERLASLARSVVESGSAGVLVVAYAFLALLDARRARRRLRALVGEGNGSWAATFSELAHDMRRYVVVRTGVGLVTGIAVGLFCWAIGLDLAFAWGLSNFLLNYIPTLGSILGVVPPVVFAATQSDTLGWPLLVLSSVGGIQLLMGNVVDPLAQGRALRMSPLAVLVAVVFWGWVWGVTGALLAIPITVTLMKIAARSEGSSWLVALLTDEP